MLNTTIAKITKHLAQRSAQSRALYLHKISEQRSTQRYRSNLSCGNLAHAFAACDSSGKEQLTKTDAANIAIVTAYNDMLSAHHPYANYPSQIKQAAIDLGASAQVAGGVPAMCDGVTQGRAGMELSLFSRDNIAMSTAVALSHDMFDAGVYLGICDKIVPGLLIGALSFGHLPGIFIPAGPMGSGLANKEKARIRQEFANGKVSKKKLLKAESESYHSAGTCTFYGTANSNQMLMEIMGLQLPGSSFEHPDSELRKPLTRFAIKQLLQLTNDQNQQPSDNCLAEIVSYKTIINGVVGLLATGGSTNHTIHLVAIARAAGIILTWEDIAQLSSIVPLICRVYPNGNADINDFHAEGGLTYVINQLLNGGYLHNDVRTVMGSGGLEQYCQKPFLAQSNTIAVSSDTSGTTAATSPPQEIEYKPVSTTQPDHTILRTTVEPFSKDGGLKLLSGNIGKAIIKTSAVATAHQTITAPALVFQTQEEFLQAFEDEKLSRDFVAVVTFQGPQSNGMPELHKLTPLLGSLQDQGYNVALITDGRMSGASGKVPAAIHLVPEALNGGNIGKIIDGDIITLDCQQNSLLVQLSDDVLEHRPGVSNRDKAASQGMGRELFSIFRKGVSPADQGASIFGDGDA
jgi:phosphogluconate dehydratase